jgi:hypothetical protein
MCLCGALDPGAHCVTMGRVCDGRCWVVEAGKRWSDQSKRQCACVMGQDG